MSDTRALLNRVTSFRQRLERIPYLIPVGAPAESFDGETFEERAHRVFSGTENAPPAQLGARAKLLLEEARTLVAAQKKVTDDNLVRSLALAPGAAEDPILNYHRATAAFTDAALRIVQAFPSSTDVQAKMADGVETMLGAIRDRLTIASQALDQRRKTLSRIDFVAKTLSDLAAGRGVDAGQLKQLAEELIAEAQRGEPIRFLEVDVRSVAAHPEAMAFPAPARFVAAHALTAAQVAAAIVGQDYEWAGRKFVPVSAALLMDVGMLRVPVEVLAKSGRWSPDERRLMERHAKLGAEMIRSVFPDADEVVSGVAAHHERFDGSGFPNGLVGERIPTLARFLAVCDHYAAHCCERPHRAAHDPRTALTETLLAADQGKLDRDFSEYLLQLAFHPVGTVVELTDGRVGVVVANHTGRSNLRATARPVVGVITDRNGRIHPRPEIIDLAAAEQGSVVRVLPKSERNALLARDYPELCG